MRARKLDLSEYPIFAENGEAAIGEDNEPVTYDVRKSILNLMFHPGLRLGRVELLEQDDLAKKILKCDGESLLLDEAEYGKVKRAIDNFTGYSRNDVEFVKRIVNAPEVEVEEAASG